MHKVTHAIAEFETDDDAKAAGYNTPLSKKEASLLRGMNRHERRAELSRMRTAARKCAKGQRA